MPATVARWGLQIGLNLTFIFSKMRVVLRRDFCKFPRIPLKRKLRRVCCPRGPPKPGPKGAQGLPRRSFFHLAAQMEVLFSVFGTHTKNKYVFFVCWGVLLFVCYFSFSFRLPKAPLDTEEALGELPGAPKDSPRAPFGRSSSLWKC